ncbi:MAG: NAD(P)-dependent alcohol dehydrogenase [Methanomassiliicoccales archaeon]
MKAVVWTRYGPPDVLKLKEVGKPVPKEDEVLIRVHATSAFAGDCELRRFQVVPSFWLVMRLYIGLTRPKRITILGQEVAGVVEAAGKGVSRFKVGDKVFGLTGMSFGGYAEYVCVAKDALLVAKTDDLTFKEAAVLSVGGLEALHFSKRANVQKGQSVLINGAGGSIGTLALQLVKASGATVTCVDSQLKLEMLKELGADLVLDYTKDDVTSLEERYDVIFDLVGKVPISKLLRSLKEEGLLILGNSGLFAPKLYGLWTTISGKRKVVSNQSTGTTEELEGLRDLVTSGRVRLVIDRSFPLERTADAHRYIEEGSKKGNAVITVVDEPTI